MYNLFRKLYDIYAVVNLPLPYITCLDSSESFKNHSPHHHMSYLNSDFSDTYQETAGSGSMSTEQSKKHLKQENSLEAKTISRTNVSTCKDWHVQMSCILEFDGASKGNPGKAGAGAILRNLDGSVVDMQQPFMWLYSSLK
ncbi:hypothetical protein BHE74_00033505 [Ensete ventricosum]|nr:hypothetical protein BHE74_00033505 [Ensete ventricosum]